MHLSDKKKTIRSLAIILVLLAFALLFTCYRHDYLRGAWISGWGTGYRNAAEIDRTISAAKEAGLNTLFVEVRKSADAYYVSGYEPMSSDVALGFDPLRYIIKRAHSNGIKVHAWVSIYRIWRGTGLPKNPNHLANRHPDWLCYSYSGKLTAPDGIFLNPGVPQVRSYITKIVADITKHYEIDGIHLDFIRYPSKDWGYSQAALSEYYRKTGARVKPSPEDPTWQQWKRDQVTNQVRDIREVINKTKPGLPISAATIVYGSCPYNFSDTQSYKYLGQDWEFWLSRGLIDANIPMNYRPTADPARQAEFLKWLDGFRRWDGGKPVFVGIASYINDPAQIKNQISDIRAAGMDGFVVFSFNESGIRITYPRSSLANQLKHKGPDLLWWKAKCRPFL